MTRGGHVEARCTPRDMQLQKYNLPFLTQTQTQSAAQNCNITLQRKRKALFYCGFLDKVGR